MTLRVSEAEYDQALDRVEADLFELAARLDKTVPDEMFPTAVLVLGHRARTLFIGFRRLIMSDVPAAAVALMRPTIEINLMLRFLVASPELHTELWIAEGERQAVILVSEYEADEELVAKLGGPGASAAWHDDRRAFIEKAREKALEAGVAGVGKRARDNVLPSMRIIAREHGDLATREAYTFAYRSLSHAIHGSSRAFDRGSFTQTGAGLIEFNEFADPEHEIRRHRALNVTTFASTLCILSEPLEIETVEDASMLKGIIMNLNLADDES